MRFRFFGKLRDSLDPLPKSVYLGSIEIVTIGMLQAVVEFITTGNLADEQLASWVSELVTLPPASAVADDTEYLRLDILIESYSQGSNFLVTTPVLWRPAVTVVSRLVRCPEEKSVDSYRVKKKMDLSQFVSAVLSQIAFFKVRTFDEDDLRHLLALALLETLDQARRRVGVA